MVWKLTVHCSFVTESLLQATFVILCIQIHEFANFSVEHSFKWSVEKFNIFNKSNWKIVKIGKLVLLAIESFLAGPYKAANPRVLFLFHFFGPKSRNNKDMDFSFCGTVNMVFIFGVS